VLEYQLKVEVPTVHVFNVLKFSFHDTNLSTDTSGFCADALITAICSFSCHYWEVRNSATLAFTALVHRMIGFLNVHKRESARRAMTGFEFFHRYPEDKEKRDEYGNPVFFFFFFMLGHGSGMR
jgi:hypothetical protein